MRERFSFQFYRTNNQQIHDDYDEIFQGVRLYSCNPCIEIRCNARRNDGIRL